MLAALHRLIVTGALLLAALPVTCGATAQQLPKNSYQYRAILTKEARSVWGVNANIALFAAQIHQESTWVAGAESRVGAKGLGQFMSGTADDMNRWYARELAGLATYSPLWSIRALVLYDRRIYNSIKPRVAPGVPECDRIAMMLSSYNGGLGWVQRDRTLASQKTLNPDLWFGQVEMYSNRATWAYAENRGYVTRILFKHLPLYLAHGYPGSPVC